jgi:hypothetical protein
VAAPLDLVGIGLRASHRDADAVFADWRGIRETTRGLQRGLVSWLANRPAAR